MALSNEVVVANVCEFVGSGHFFFVANINKEFREAYQHYLRTTTTPAANRSLFVTTADSITESEARFRSVLDKWDATTTSVERNRSPPNCFEAVMGSAARRGNLPVIKWYLHPDRNELFEVLQWNNRHVQETICEIAARQGHLDVLQYAMERGYENGLHHSTTICNAAAEGGQLHILQWARENGWFQCSKKNICYLAAVYGHLHVLQWARENGCH